MTSQSGVHNLDPLLLQLLLTVLQPCKNACIKLHANAAHLLILASVALRMTVRTLRFGLALVVAHALIVLQDHFEGCERMTACTESKSGPFSHGGFQSVLALKSRRTAFNSSSV
jgi:hypothetical protein